MNVDWSMPDIAELHLEEVAILVDLDLVFASAVEPMAIADYC